MEVADSSTRLRCSSSSGLPKEDCALGLIDDMTCGLYQPLSKMITDQANQWFPVADAETNANDIRNDDSRTTNENSLSYSADYSDGIDVSADLNEIERGQAALLRELAQTKEQLLQDRQENRTTKNKNGGKGSLFKILRLGGGRASNSGGGSGSNSKDKENNPNNNKKQSSTKSRRILSFNGRSKRGSAGKNKNNLNATSGTADYSNDRTVLAVVNDSGVDLVNLTLQKEDASSTTEAVDISSSTAGSGGSADTSIDLVLVSELALGVITNTGREAPSSKEAAPTSKETASTNVTVEDPTFVLDMSSVDGTTPSFTADADVVKDSAGEKPQKPTNTIPSTTGGGGSADDDESPPDRSEFVIPVANLLERVYGAEAFGGEDRWVRTNLILDTYKGREDALIQSLLVKAAEREAKQKKAPKQRNDTSTRSAAATPADSFNLDVSSIVAGDEDVDAITTGSSPGTAAPAPTPPQAPSKTDLTFSDIPVRPFEDDAGVGSGNEENSPSEEIDTTGDSTAAGGYDVADDDSLFADLERNDAELVDNAAPSSLPARPTTDGLSANAKISSPPSKSEHVPSHGTTSSMQSDESSAFDFGQYTTSNPFQNPDEKENKMSTMPSFSSHPPISSDEQFGYMYANQRRAGPASTRLRSILQEPKAFTN